MANSSWLSHVRKTMYENAGISLTQLIKRANRTYKKKKGGSRKRKIKKSKSRKKPLNKKIKKRKNKKK